MVLISQLLKSSEFQDQEIRVLKFKSCRRALSSALLCSPQPLLGSGVVLVVFLLVLVPASLISGHSVQTFLALDF